MSCKHNWKEDELFESGGVVMMFGSLEDINQETRVICRNCGKVEYIKKTQNKDKTNKEKKQ